MKGKAVLLIPEKKNLWGLLTGREGDYRVHDARKRRIRRVTSREGENRLWFQGNR